VGARSARSKSPNMPVVSLRFTRFGREVRPFSASTTVEQATCPGAPGGSFVFPGRSSLSLWERAGVRAPVTQDLPMWPIYLLLEGQAQASPSNT
jgi:hypothetical protein